MGWGQDRHLLADIYDALNLNTKATGNFKKAPDFPPWPRPTRDNDTAEKKPVTVADIYARFTRR